MSFLNVDIAVVAMWKSGGGKISGTELFISGPRLSLRLNEILGI